ncbi:MAG: nuclear transport factor 2 family protein [Proteobacteria bacterium]|nr:nuclear transport factor 2 family protein [Pseudomonadota bacterium]
MRLTTAHVAFALALGLATITAPALADDHKMTEEGRAAVSAFVAGVHGGPDAIAPLLAPEYQIMRSNGVGYGRAGYIEHGVGTVKSGPDFALDELVATQEDDVMVVRYMLSVEETIQGKTVAKRAPRLTVFRKIDGQWKVVAHGNFASIE